MLQLYRITEDVYEISNKGKRVRLGCIRSTVRHLQRLGVPWQAIEDSITSLRLNGHYVAFYGRVEDTAQLSFIISLPISQ